MEMSKLPALNEAPDHSVFRLKKNYSLKNSVVTMASSYNNNDEDEDEDDDNWPGTTAAARRPWKLPS